MSKLILIFALTFLFTAGFLMGQSNQYQKDAAHINELHEGIETLASMFPELKGEK